MATPYDDAPMRYAICNSPAYCLTGSASCLYPTPSFSGHLTARPSIVAKGGNAKVYWNVSNVVGCTVTGTNGDSWSGTSSGESGKLSKGITQQTIFTLTCTALDSSSLAETATVNLIPEYRER